MLRLPIGRIAVCCILLTNASAQTGSKTAGLSKPVDWGFYSPRLFQDDSHTINFHLTTSWIPGENHKGSFRYRLEAFVPNSDSDSKGKVAMGDDIEVLMKRVEQCTVFLTLYDKDDFLLRKHEIPFTFGVNEKAHITGLTANDAFQMDAQEYRNFTVSGSWALSWTCAVH